MRADEPRAQDSKSFAKAVPANICPPACVRAARHVIRLILLVTALTVLVYQPIAVEALGEAPHTGQMVLSAKSAETKPGSPTPDAPAPAYERRTDLSNLPRPVAEMIDAILVAVNSGEIEELRTAIEWNELPPSFGPDRIEDPIAFLKEASADKSGHQMLAILGNLLSVGPAHLPIGRDIENTGVLVWPYLAERPLDALTPAEEVDLYRLVPADVIAGMREKKRWTWYRIVIGADGTWHAFMRQD